MSRIYFYSHDALGLGHLRRNLNVATEAVHKIRDITCLLLTGSQVPGVFRFPPRTDFLKLPSLVKTARGTYESALPFEQSHETTRLRAELILTLIKERPPDILYVDKHPAGLAGELLPSLTWIRKHARHCRVFLGLRDVLDDPDVADREWRMEQLDHIVEKFYNRVCVCGDERIYDTTNQSGFGYAVQQKARYVGFVLPRIPAFTGPVRPNHIVASVGGGTDGEEILHMVIAAIIMLRHSRPVTASVYTGPLMPRPHFRILRGLAAPHSAYIRVERFSRDYLREVSASGLVVTMGGYNSLLEAVRLGRPALVIPRIAPRREQMIRARAFERAGCVRVADPSDLTPRVLAEAMNAELDCGQGPRTSPDIDFGGASAIARSLRHTLKTGTVADL